MSESNHSFEITDLPKQGMRLDHYLASKLPEMSRSRIQAMIKDGHATVNDELAKSNHILRNDDRVSLDIPEPEALEDTLPEKMDLDILYEDKHLLVINKPAGLTVHPGAGQYNHTLVNGLLHHCGKLSEIGGVHRPGIVHRLDKETSGCIVIAKNDAAHHGLTEQFSNREVTKVYLTVVKGRITPPIGTVDAPIGRHRIHRKKMAVVEGEDGREAQTNYRVLAYQEPLSLVECRPRTGRTHQIRVHLKHLGHPIVGDAIYGSRGTYTRHLLHAWKLAFKHPKSGKPLEFTAPIPAEFPLRTGTSGD